MSFPFVLRTRHDQVASQLVQAQDRLRRYEYELDQLREELREANKASREAREMVADWLAQRQFGQKIFNSSGPALPSQAPDAELLDKFNQEQGSRQARSRVRAGEMAFAQRLREALEANAPSPASALAVE